MRSTDCLKCNFPRDEPKGNRKCKKCDRLEGQAKGSAHRGLIDYPQTDVKALVQTFDPLAAFLAAEPEPAALPPPVAPSNTAAPLMTIEGASEGGPVATAVEVSAKACHCHRTMPDCQRAANGVCPLERTDYRASGLVEALPAVRAIQEAHRAEVERGHSPLGGSRAKQFMNCTGSTALIAQLGLTDDDTESEYSREGTQAHALVAHCLEHGFDAWAVLVAEPDGYSLVKLDDAPLVQLYIDYVRSRPGRKRFEVPFHRPELHQLYWGAIDAELIPVSGVGGLVLEIVDYKHGAGVYVNEVRNPQGMYYAAGVIMEDESFFPDEGEVWITVAQPRVSWVDNPIRTWKTTVAEIKRWLREECLPAMNVRTQDMVLSLGDWCQFCPAKLVCRAMTEVYKQFATAAGGEPLAMSDEQLGTEFTQAPFVRMRAKAIEQEVLRRLLDGRTVPLAQLERGKTDRVWKDKITLARGDGSAYDVTLEEAAKQMIGKDAWSEPKIKSPAQIEKLPNAKDFVAAWAYSPEAPLRAGLAGGKPAVQLPSPEERYGDASQYLVANKTA